MLHPYIVKISNTADNRQGLDFAFSFFVIISCLIWGVKKDLKLGLILSVPVALNLINQSDFNLYYSTTQSYNYIIASVFLLHISGHIKEIEPVFHKAVIFTTFGATAFYISNELGFNPRIEFINNFYEGVKIKRVYGQGTNYGGFLLNPNLTGAYFALSIPSFFRVNMKKWAVIPGAMIFTTTSWPIITAVSFLLMFLVKRYIHRLLPYLGAILTIISTYFYVDRTKLWVDSGRFLIWEQSLDLYFKSNWMLGNGLGWFAEKFSRFYRPLGYLVKQEHNEFLAALYAFGPIGLLLLIGAFWHLSKAQNAVTRAAIFCIFINILCAFSLHISSLFILIGFWAAIAYHEVKHDKKAL